MYNTITVWICVMQYESCRFTLIHIDSVWNTCLNPLSDSLWVNESHTVLQSRTAIAICGSPVDSYWFYMIYIVICLYDLWWIIQTRSRTWKKSMWVRVICYVVHWHISAVNQCDSCIYSVDNGGNLYCPTYTYLLDFFDFIGKKVP